MCWVKTEKLLHLVGYLHRTKMMHGHTNIKFMLQCSRSVVCIESRSNHLLTTWTVDTLSLTSWWSSWMRFLVHVRMLVQTMSRPWNCCVLPDRSHSSSSRIKILWQCRILHTWSAPETCSSNTMCSFNLSLCAIISCNLLVGHILKWIQMGQTKYCQPLREAHTGVLISP